MDDLCGGRDVPFEPPREDEGTTHAGNGHGNGHGAGAASMNEPVRRKAKVRKTELRVRTIESAAAAR